MGIGVLLVLQKIGEGTFFHKKGEVGKIVEEWSLLRENNLCFLPNLCVYKSKKHYNSRCIYIHIYIYIYIYVYLYIYIYIYIYIYHGMIGVHRFPLIPKLQIPPLAISDPHMNICARPPNTCVASKQFNLLRLNTLFWSNFIYYRLTHQFEVITLVWIKTCVKWFCDNS